MFTIFGGCATRDIFRVVDRLDLVSNHFACSTIPAITSKRSPHVAGLALPADMTNFDRRMLNLDLFKDHTEVMVGDMSEGPTTHVAIDLISERYPVLKSGSSIYTESWIHIKYGEALFGSGASALSAAPDAPVLSLPPLTKERHAMFMSSFSVFLEMLARAGIPADHVILHSCFNAISTAGYANRQVRRMFDAANRENDYLARIYDQIARDFPEVQMFAGQTDLMVMNPDHAWGQDTVHYVDDYYFSAYSALSRVVPLPERVSV